MLLEYWCGELMSNEYSWFKKKKRFYTIEQKKKIDSVKSLITSIVGSVVVHYSQVNDFVFDYAGLLFFFLF